MVSRALLAFLALPGAVAFAAPLAIAWSAGRFGSFNWFGLAALVPGITLLLWCVREFYTVGKGTLAPWAPPRYLVSSGLYRYSRNPMYLAVTLILLGWAIGFSSAGLLVYAGVVLILFHVRVLLHEEPYLARTHREEWKRYASRVPRWIFPGRRAVVIAWAAFLLALPIAGLIYEAIADGIAQREFAPPGQLVDIGGRQLHLVCIGDGEPIVFFEASGWGTSLSSATVRERLAGRTRVCSYDRSGNGWSPAGASTVSAGDLARDMAVLQDRAALPSPFLVVASSIGGLTAEMYARQFPERTAGLVLVDGANSQLLPLLESVEGRARVLMCTTSALARFGLLRLWDPFALDDVEENRRAIALTYSPRPWGQLCAIARGVDRTKAEFAAAPPLPADLPLVALSAAQYAPPFAPSLVDAETILAALQQSHQQMAKQSTRGKWQLVADADHLIGETHPDVVADLVLELLEELR